MILTVSMLAAAVPAGTAFAEGEGSFGQGPGMEQMQEMPQMNGDSQGMHGGENQQAFPGNDGMQAPPENGTMQAPQNEENMPAPQNGENMQAPADGNVQEAPANGNTEEAPAEGSMQAPPAEENMQAPQMNGQPGMSDGCRGNRGGKQSGRMNGRENGPVQVPFEKMVQDGTISQETYEAIRSFMKENAPERPENLSEDEAESGKPEKKDLLQDLLDNGVITQEQYDAIAAVREKDHRALDQSAPSADGESAESAAGENAADEVNS